jgi:hypothetical protein
MPYCCHSDAQTYVNEMEGDPTPARHTAALEVARCQRPPVAADINGDRWCREHAPEILARDAETVCLYTRRLVRGFLGLAVARVAGR